MIMSFLSHLECPRCGHTGIKYPDVLVPEMPVVDIGAEI